MIFKNFFLVLKALHHRPHKSIKKLRKLGFFFFQPRKDFYIYNYIIYSSVVQGGLECWENVKAFEVTHRVYLVHKGVTFQALKTLHCFH